MVVLWTHSFDFIGIYTFTNIPFSDGDSNNIEVSGIYRRMVREFVIFY